MRLMVSPRLAFACSSKPILRRTLHTVNDGSLYGTFRRFELQAKLVVERLLKRRPLLWVRLSAHIGCRRTSRWLWCPLEREIITSAKVCLIHWPFKQIEGSRLRAQSSPHGGTGDIFGPFPDGHRIRRSQPHAA